MAISHFLNETGSTSSVHELRSNITTVSNCTDSNIKEDKRLTTQFGSEDLPEYLSFDNSTMQLSITTTPDEEEALGNKSKLFMIRVNHWY